MSHDEALARIAELEDALARKTFEAEMHKQSVKSLLHLIPYVPPTEEELREMTTNIHGPQIRDLIAELERELA